MSSIRTCWRELGIGLDSNGVGTRSALRGYTNIFNELGPDRAERGPWPATFTITAQQRLGQHRRAHANADRSTLVGPDQVAHITMASLCFCRAGPTQALSTAGATITTNGINVTFHKQKRPREAAPSQFLPSGSSRSCPVAWLARVLPALGRGRQQPRRLFLGRPGGAIRDEATQQQLSHLHLSGHSAWVGAASGAFAIGVLPALGCGGSH